MSKPRRKSGRRLPSSKGVKRAPQSMDERLTKLLKRSITLAREIRKLAKIVGATVPKVTIKVKK